MTTETLSALVRPLVVLALTGGVIWGFADGKIDGPTFMALSSSALAWLFSERTSSKAHEAGVQAALTVPPGLQNPPNGGPG